MKRSIYIVLILGLTIMSCNPKEEVPTAYGHFETTEITISAESSGVIQELNGEEGQLLESGALLVLTDTLSPYLQVKVLEAQKKAIRSKMSGILAQKEIINTEMEGLDRELNRIIKLEAEGAATKQEVSLMKDKVASMLSRLQPFNSQLVSVGEEEKVTDAQIDVYQHMIQKAHISCPADLTLLEKYVEIGELAVPGKPLCKLVDMSTMYLRAYVSGAQLSELSLDQVVKVRIDQGEDGYYTYDGTISWIAGQAEFTPKIIQTKETRVDLVYAVKVRVKNDGKIKIGMPGELIL